MTVKTPPLFFILFSFILVFYVQNAKAHFKPGRHNAVHAIYKVWCGYNNRPCAEGRYAVGIAKCEASDKYWYLLNRPTEARNGQYLGMFQMGAREREQFGHGRDPWSQARAAHRYWRISGWNPWECRLYV